MTDQQLIDAIKRAEGWPKYTDRPNDKGGPTKGGITLQTLRNWRRDPTLTAADLQRLMEAEADAIYQFEFIQPFAKIPESRLKHYLVDLGVLRGPRAAGRMLQMVVGAYVDGWIGAKTLALVKAVGYDTARVMVIGARFVHIEDVCRADPSQLEFRSGWRRRNASFL